MLFAMMFLAASFSFSHNKSTVVAGRDTWTFVLQNGVVGDKLETVSYKEGAYVGKIFLCEVQSGSACSSSVTPQEKDIGLWAGDVLINGEKNGEFMVWVSTQKEISCQIPNWISIRDALYPCWTLERVKKQYIEAEANVWFARWLMDLPFSISALEDNSALSPKITVIEHPDIFTTNGRQAVGVFNVGRYGIFGPDQVEYSIKHEATILPIVLMHELGHKRELDEERKRNTNAVNTFGWWHFGHGDFLDPLVKATNFLKDWFFRGLPQTHSYYPGQIGKEPVAGSPGAFSPTFPPNIDSQSPSNYRFESNEKDSGCIFLLE